MILEEYWDGPNYKMLGQAPNGKIVLITVLQSGASFGEEMPKNPSRRKTKKADKKLMQEIMGSGRQGGKTDAQIRRMKKLMGYQDIHGAWHPPVRNPAGKTVSLRNFTGTVRYNKDKTVTVSGVQK